VTERATVVLDASAVLALLHREPGADRVAEALPRAAVSSVNWSEVLQKTIARGISIEGMRDDLQALGLRIVAFGSEDAEVAALLRSKTRHLGLSLGDRACLATGIRERARVLTADRSWARLDIGVKVEALRT
jgi:PIN domain nuclease of toxin-antitoxin system